MKKEYIECDCYSPQHSMKFIYFDESKEDKDYVYVSIFLRNGNFFERFLKAIKYIFGYKSKFGHFDEFILNNEEAERLKKLLENFLG